jgi:hypothetical protein
MILSKLLFGPGAAIIAMTAVAGGESISCTNYDPTKHTVIVDSISNVQTIIFRSYSAKFRVETTADPNVVKFTIEPGQLESFRDSMRSWPEVARDKNGRLLADLGDINTK